MRKWNFPLLVAAKILTPPSTSHPTALISSDVHTMCRLACCVGCHGWNRKFPLVVSVTTTR